jgi:uncharacterized membrane protein YraQ (UPF0718 family)
MAGLVINSTAVLRLNFCAKLNICALISATSPSCKTLWPILKNAQMTLTETIIGLVIVFFSGYLISYFKEKGKNKALLSDIKRLTEEKERIVSDFKLEIEKRKYQYESKKEQYFKYFNLIDEFGKSGNDDFYENFFPIVEL